MDFLKRQQSTVPPPPNYHFFFFCEFFWGGGINFVFENFGLENFYTGGRHFGASRIWAPASWSITLIRWHYWDINFDFGRFGAFLESVFELKFGLIERVLPK